MIVASRIPHLSAQLHPATLRAAAEQGRRPAAGAALPPDPQARRLVQARERLGSTDHLDRVAA